MNEEVNKVLKILSAEGIDYAVYGTYGLLFYKPFIVNFFKIDDCDILLKPDKLNVIKALNLIRSLGYKLTVWEKEIENKINYKEELEDKFYARTIINHFQVDFTYEHFYSTDYNENVFKRMGIKVCEEASIIKIKSKSNREKDIQFLNQFYPDIYNNKN